MNIRELYDVAVGERVADVFERDGRTMIVFASGLGIALAGELSSAPVVGLRVVSRPKKRRAK